MNIENLYPLIGYIVSFYISYKIFKVSLNYNHIKVDEHSDYKVFCMLCDIRCLTGNKNFDIFITEDQDIGTENYFKNAIFKIYKPNCTLISKKTIDRILGDENGEEQLFFYLCSESLFRSPLKSTILISIFSYIIETLEKVKIYNIILFPYFRWKRKKCDEKTFHLTSADPVVALNSIYNMKMKNIYSVYEKNYMVLFNQFIYAKSSIFFWLRSVAFYDLLPVERAVNFVKNNSPSYSEELIDAYNTFKDKKVEPIPLITD